MSGSRFTVQGFNANRTIVHAESPQLAQEKSGFNGTKLNKQPLNREPGTLNLSSYKNQTTRNQDALLNEQIDKLREENQRIRDENEVLTKKLTMLQLKHETPSSKSYEFKKEGYKTKLMYVQERSVRVRTGPGTDYRTVGGRRLGDKIFAKDLEGDWYRVVDPKDFDKTIGWIHRSLLDKMPPGQ